MSTILRFLIIGSLCWNQIDFLEASYQCGIRKHSFVQLVHRGWKVEEGQWPWHVALFHVMRNSSLKYACGATLLDQKHILTAAHCVVNGDTGYPLPAASIELHFGQQNLSKMVDHVQVRDVRKVHIHPEHSTHRNDIAVLVLRLPVEYTDYVIPICIDQRADRDLRNLEGQRGWIAGWGTTQSGAISDVLRTASLPVVSYLQCFNDDQTLFGNILNPNVFCAGDRNGTSPGTGDSGGGMYFSEGDRWVLRGIVSFASADELKAEVDTSKYAVFVNVQRFLTWIKEIMDESKPESDKGPKRISETECERFKGLARKRANGLCANSKYPHTVSLIYGDGLPKCTGILVNEDHVVTACHCVNPHIDTRNPVRVRIGAYGEMNISRISCHRQYTHASYYHDLAIIKLSSPITLSSSLIPACLASNWTENLYDTLLQTGFGKSSSSHAQDYIESDENQVISQEECDRLMRAQSGPSIIPAQLCVINTDRLRTNSVGSSGSPLQTANSRTCMHTVVGVASLGILDSEEIRKTNITVVDVYSRVAYYLDWIEQVVWNVQPLQVTTTVRTRKVESSTTSKVAGDFVFPDN